MNFKGSRGVWEQQGISKKFQESFGGISKDFKAVSGRFQRFRGCACGFKTSTGA